MSNHLQHEIMIKLINESNSAIQSSIRYQPMYNKSRDCNQSYYRNSWLSQNLFHLQITEFISSTEISILSLSVLWLYHGTTLPSSSILWLYDKNSIRWPIKNTTSTSERLPGTAWSNALTKSQATLFLNHSNVRYNLKIYWTLPSTLLSYHDHLIG